MSKQDGSGRQVTAEPTDDASATIFHVDMDAFFASVELLERPELRGLPVVVGHRSQRSVVTAATYEARKYGVNSAMPMAIALRKCPQAIILEPHFERYKHYSQQVMSMFDDVTPLVERLGIDEAFLDVRGSLRLLGTPYEIATRLRQRVHAETGLHCSIGIASTKFVAKLASSVAKPDGLLLVPHRETLAFLHPRPISALWGVGGRTEEVLRGYGLATIGDVAAAPLDMLVRAIGAAGGQKIHELAWGRDPRHVTTESEEKSVGHEVTFESNVGDADRIRSELLRLSDQVGRRLRAAGATGRTVVLKLRFGDFETITRSKTLAEPTDLGRRIYEEVRGVYETSGHAGSLSRHPTPLRLVGVRMEQLAFEGSSGGAVGLWDDDADWREAETTMDALRARFGPGSVTSASLLGGSTKRISRGDRDTNGAAQRGASATDAS
ncbi:MULTISPECIES: DNA polymerase IV [unclassified Frondihabitans]|uniref:DNA polymerase IV n=1 Tax=unclassified Frondihabitans TaxID=2626248 RepID=UPI000F4E46FE|nr:MULTISPECIES: DNA polymerase IV [unclassified Frondihabitans]RPE74998.1 DNA polymerase-4 [Frondihabitans sp. PhB153]RPF04242.1 DNA polymerase-4 [Frondihabitans sp. PhB161]